MRRLFLVVFAIGFSIAWTSSAQAQWGHGAGSELIAGCKRNNMWPEPFIYPDRESVRLPIQLIVEKGWRKQNLLSQHHFDDTTHQLNQAGELKLQFILTQLPSTRRAILIERGVTPEITTSRISSAEQVASRILPANQVPEISESSLVAEGSPADDVDNVYRQFNKTRPDPRLPKATPTASGSGS